jgi:large subunit ribosomal protein L17
MACSLVEHKRITTTLAKAKELRKFVEPLITKSKTDSTHSRRVVFSNLHSKNAVTELFREVAPKVGERPGGYTRIIKLGTRLGDAAEMAMIELVDFNELMLQEDKPKAKRSRRGGGKKASGASKATEAKTEASAEAPAAKEESKAETKEAPKAEASAEATAPKEAKKEEAPEAKEEPKSDTEDKKDEKKD